MANTYVDYTAVASQTDYNFSFEYLRDDHVKVKVNDVIVTNYTIVTSPVQLIRFDTAPTASAEIRIYRDSRGDFSPLVDFEDGSVLTQVPLDEAYRHNLFVAQEASEGTGNELLNKKGGANYDAEGNKIINLGTPTTATDAATKSYVDQTIDNAELVGGSPATVSLGAYDVTSTNDTLKQLRAWTADIETNASNIATNTSNISNASNSNVTATGSTTARSLADRFADVVNVLDYGVKNDGTEPASGDNNTTRIQAAIDSGAKSVFFPSGTYIADSITMPGSVRIFGEYEQSEIKLKTGPLLIKNQFNHVDNLKFSLQAGATCTEIIKFKGVSTASITAYNHLNRLFISASPTIDAIVFDATEKENLWNYIDTITIRNCKNGISFYAPNGNSSLYNNSNFTQRLDIHTCVKGVYFDDGYNEANIIAGLEVGEATTYELDFNNKAGASVSRTNIQDYISWDFLGTTRVNGYPNGGIMEGDSTTRLFAQVSGEYAATPLVLERNDSAGSVFAKYKNSSKSLNVGINSGLSGAPFHIPDITVMNSLRITDGVTIPAAISGYASIYVDASDGDLKVKFGDGTVKTIATDF